MSAYASCLESVGVNALPVKLSTQSPALPGNAPPFSIEIALAYFTTPPLVFPYEPLYPMATP